MNRILVALLATPLILLAMAAPSHANPYFVCSPDSDGSWWPVMVEDGEFEPAGSQPMPNSAVGCAAYNATSTDQADPDPEPTSAPTSTRSWKPCRSEDGSGQRRCIWDARHLGNGRGQSLMIFYGGTDHAIYNPIRHKRAHRLLFG